MADRVRAGGARVADGHRHQAVDDGDQPARLGPCQLDVVEDELAVGVEDRGAEAQAGLSDLLRDLRRGTQACGALPRVRGGSPRAWRASATRAGSWCAAGPRAEHRQRRPRTGVLRIACAPVRAPAPATRPALGGRRRCAPSGWSATRVLARLGAALLRARHPGRVASTCARGAAGDELLPGMSDIDLALVAPPTSSAPGGGGTALVRRASLGRPADRPPATSSMRPSCRRSLGLRAARSGWARGDVVLLRRAPQPRLDPDAGGTRPATASAADWRLLRGPDRRPPPVARDEQDERLAAWLRGRCCGGAGRSSSAISRRRRAPPTCA